MFEPLVYALVVVAVLFALVPTSQAVICDDISGSGCQLNSFVGAIGQNCQDINNVSLPLFNPTPFCQFDELAVAPTASGGDCIDIAPGYCLAFVATCCTPTPEPTRMPTEEPTPLPTEEPTPLPTNEPTPEPTFEPTSRPTKSPVEASPAFFEVEENIYIVAGAGGGGLLLLAAAALLWRRRSSGGGGAPAVASADGGESKGATPMKITAESDIFDWEKHIDKKSGEVYFFNPKTGESRWEPPEVKAT